MDTRIHFFSQRDVIKNVSPEFLGIRGRQANEFAELKFPILPGFIIDSTLASKIDPGTIKKDFLTALGRISAFTGKHFGDPDNPMLLKVVISSNLAITNYPVLHNLGLTKPVIKGFSNWVGRDFAVREVLFLIRGVLKIEERIKELEADIKLQKEISDQLAMLDQVLCIRGPSNEPGNEGKKPVPLNKNAEFYMDFYAGFFQKGFFENAEEQILICLGEISSMFRMDNQNDNDTALMISPMVYGNYGKDSCSGAYFSRNVVTGEKILQGSFSRQKINESGSSGQSIEKIAPVHYKELKRIAWTLEDKFKEIRQILFTVENGKLWLLEQRLVDKKSAQADLKLLLDLARRKVIGNAELIKSIEPLRLNEILHPVIDSLSVKGLKYWKGGIAGAPGAAIGRAYFSTGALLEAHRAARQKGEDTRFILILESSFAEDVKAIELSTGVLTAEGGYSAHASVVARQYGKASLVAPEMKFKRKTAVLGDLRINEGDYLTLQVPFYGECNVYLGTAKLIEPDPKKSGLLDFIGIAKGFLNNFHVRCNADTSRDAALALNFGADGVGVCRTEHMFFQEDRINIFREMLFLPDPKDRAGALAKLQVMQMKDFYGLFKVMAGKEVTIRLLDSPLYEFMPHNDEEMKSFIYHMQKIKGKKISRAELIAGVEALHEFNPMLGHRGCRIAVSFPEIYIMQVKAIFEAAYKLCSEKIDVQPEIMVPVIMNASELKLIAFGKKIEGKSYTGIVDIEEEIRKKKKAKPLEYQIGTMIELPAAALGAGEIAKYSRFFSFGTNDLTQTTLGISRDDFTAFISDYTLFDLIIGNPFSTLDPRVKELISLAVERGRLTRPDLVCGLCGEHGANPINVRFCMDAGLNYVSCSPYSVPIALLAAAQAELEKAETRQKA